MNKFDHLHTNKNTSTRISDDAQIEKLFFITIRGIDTLSGEVTIIFSNTSKKGSVLTGKNLLPVGANCFPLV